MGSKTPFLIIVAEKAILPLSHEPQKATIAINLETGKICDVHSRHRASKDEYKDVNVVEWYEIDDNCVLFPGLVDTHVHLNEPGRTSWEGFATGTQAAITGGVTTVVDMPLNSLPPTTTVENLRIKQQAAQNQCWADVGFWGGVIPGNQDHLIPLVNAGVRGFKCFLAPSGVDEFPHVEESDLDIAMNILQDKDTFLMFHAETDLPYEAVEIENKLENDYRKYQTFLDSRPQRCESSAIRLVSDLSLKYPRLRTHIVHLSAADSLPILKNAKSASSPCLLSAETCFHYLCLQSEDVQDGKCEFKCCPPIREARNQDRLWEALLNDEILYVVSDHSPCVPSLKLLDKGDFMGAWGGIGSLGLGLSLLHTEGSKRNIKNLFGYIALWCSERPSIAAKLDNFKGKIAPNFDADFAIFDPMHKFIVSKNELKCRNKVSPYEGMHLDGKVVRTILRGKTVWELGMSEFVEPSGRLL